MDKEIKQVRNFLTYEHTQATLYKIIQNILGLIAGGLIGTWISLGNTSDEWLVFSSVLSTVLYLVLVIMEHIRSAKYPVIVIDNLQAQRQLENKKSELRRKDTIYLQVNKAIESLNDSTCAYTPDNDTENKLCSNPLEVGLQGVLNMIIQFPHVLVDSDTARFTVVLHTFGTLCKDPKNHELVYKDHTLRFRDDFNLFNEIKYAQTAKDQSTDFSLLLYSQGLNSKNNVKLLSSSYTYNDEQLKVITAPLPAICEGVYAGVFYIICEDKFDVPADLENVMLIFGRIAANWITKYEECFSKKHEMDSYYYEMAEENYAGVKTAMEEIKTKKITGDPRILYPDLQWSPEELVQAMDLQIFF